MGEPHPTDRAYWTQDGRLRFRGGYISEDRARALGVMTDEPRPMVRFIAVPIGQAPPAAVPPPQPPPDPPPPPAADNVIPLRAGVNVAAALEALRRAQPPPAPAGDPPGPPTVLPPAPASPPSRLETETFAQVAAGMVTNVSLAGMAAIIRRRGREPNEPDESDVERVRAATATGIAQSIGDKPIPWWMTVMFGYGNIGMQMWIGAPPRTGEPNNAAVLEPSRFPAESSGRSAGPNTASSGEAPAEPPAQPNNAEVPARRPPRGAVMGFPKPIGHDGGA